MKKLIPALLMAALLSACSASETKNQSAESSPSKTMPSAEAMIAEISFEAVETNLREALNKRDLKLFTVVNHGEGAKSVGMDIGQSKLFIFGNPKSGTPLMMANREMGLELPMKVLIYTTEQGKVAISHTDIKAFATQYGLTDQVERLEKIETTLTAISKEAIGNPQ